MKQEVVVVMADEATAGPPSPALPSTLEKYDATLTPVFEQPSQTPRGLAGLAQLPPAEASAYDAELGRYYRADVSPEAAPALAESLRELPEVQSVYIKPAVENPRAPGCDAPPAPLAVTPPSQIPDFRALQGYLDAAPGGVNAAAAWTLSGGRGFDVRIIDIEGGWCFSHLDLRANLGGLLDGVAYPTQSWRDHGTAVLGEISGDDNPYGITGLAPDAVVAAVSHNPRGSAAAIQYATSKLRAGDILLLEMHRPGPRFNFANRPDQRGYIPVEWWPDDFLAILGATAKGVIVIEAAGNGAEDLNDPLYDAPGQGFPADWRNPFRGQRDSGAIMVGAGAPPSGSFGVDRSRLTFSNHGQRVDCQGWGRGVATTGYGDMFRGVNEDRWYTGDFSGTSSASPIVAGVAACVQGVLKARGRLSSPGHMRGLLRTTGSPQVATPAAPLSQHIGPRPDLVALLTQI